MSESTGAGGREADFLGDLIAGVVTGIFIFLLHLTVAVVVVTFMLLKKVVFYLIRKYNDSRI